jgi:hypothetical protein
MSGGGNAPFGNGGSAASSDRQSVAPEERIHAPRLLTCPPLFIRSQFSKSTSVQRADASTDTTNRIGRKA